MTTCRNGMLVSLVTGANKGIGLENEGEGHSVKDGTDPIMAFALGGPDTPTGAYRDRDGDGDGDGDLLW